VSVGFSGWLDFPVRQRFGDRDIRAAADSCSDSEISCIASMTDRVGGLERRPTGLEENRYAGAGQHGAKERICGSRAASNYMDCWIG
jgi:hypothetical protein